MSGIGFFGIGTSTIGRAIGYVTVPFAPGVPPVLRDPSIAQQAAQGLMTSDAPGVGSSQQGPQWGVFDEGGNAVVSPDSVIDVAFDKEYRISDYPVEQGGFQSYNKVATPYDFRITMAKSGPQSDVQLFLDAVDAMVESDAVYVAVAGGVAYKSANAVRYDYSRKATSGVTLITVHVFMREVRQTASAVAGAPSASPAPLSGGSPTTFANTAAPSGAAVINNGNVQGSAPTSAQAITLGLGPGISGSTLH